MIAFTSIIVLCILSVVHSVPCNGVFFFDGDNNEIYFRSTEVTAVGDEKTSDIYGTELVKIQYYYECLCPYCRSFDTEQLVPAIKKLSEYLDINVYPYGNAKMNEENGKITFQCQHGEKECYGNKLHACSIDILNDIAKAVIFNSCMMEENQPDGGSNDASADSCGKTMKIDVEPIKKCAKSERGDELLKQYGEETNKVSFPGVPYVLVNGKETDADNFMNDICSAFKNPPPPCL